EVGDDVASAKGVGRQDDVDVFAQPVLAAGVTLDVVVIGDAFPAQVEVLRLEASGQRNGGSGVRTGRGSHSDRIQIEVLLIRNDLQDMLAGGKRHAFLADPLESAPATGVGHGNGCRYVDTVDFDVEGASGKHAARPDLDVIEGAGGHVDRVGEPLSGLEVIDDV